MRKFTLLFIILFVVGMTNVYSQNSVKAQKENITERQVKSYPVDPRPFLEKDDATVREFFEENPGWGTKGKFKTTTWTFVVGSTYDWWVSDFRDDPDDEFPDFYQTPSTCRGVGTHCYIFVEDDQWGVNVDQAGVDAFIDGFDNTTPNNASKGIYELDSETFGPVPDLDSDEKIVILILDIQDGWDPDVGGGYVAGYFHSLNEIAHENSNSAEMYYSDCYPADVNSDDALGTCAHEFQHMIHWWAGENLSKSSPTFYNEGCSLIAEHVCGYPFREQASYASEPNQDLETWRDGNEVLTDYSRAARFFLYLYEQFGSEFLNKFVQSTAALGGKDAINDALANLTTPTSRRYDNVLIDWFIANKLDDKTVDPKWGYDLAGLAKPVGTEYFTPNVPAKNSSVARRGVEYIGFKSGENLTINFDVGQYGGNFIKVYAIKMGSGASVVEAVATGQDVNFAGFGTTYTTIHFVVGSIVTNTLTPWAYTYTASGSGAVEYNVTLFEDGFETYTDFAHEFSPWTLVDVDQSNNYSITDVEFDSSGDPAAFIIFNPTATTPATSVTTHGGNKIASCFACTSPPNDDWMITPQVTLDAGGGQFSFWAQSYTAEYGLERFKVGVSTTDTNPASFTIISSGTYEEAPTSWTQFVYDLAAYAGQDIYLGIQCVSNDAFIFSVDDVAVKTAGEAEAVELAWDTTEPVGVLSNQNPGDKVLVEFPGMPGYKIQSISVALRQAGSVTGSVYEYSGTITAPLGTQLASGIVATSTITERPAYDQGAQSYPVPWPNWVTVDVEDMDIDASNNFAIVFDVTGIYGEPYTEENNRVMITTVPGTSYYHSIYQNSGTGAWAYPANATDNVSYLFMIRANVIQGTVSGIGDDVIELLPTSYALEQNYPNPFNPTTNIQFVIPESSNVELKVYDIMGREVASLLNEELSAGSHQVVWNGNNNFGQRAASGIYFYTIKTSNFVQTKKMVLMK